MQTLKAQLVLDARATLGEGPCWVEREKKLYWVDIMQKMIHRYDPATGLDEAFELDQHPGAIVPRRQGGFIAALQHGFYFYDPDEGRLEPIHDPESHLPGNRFNDGKCDPYGRFWAGTMSMRGESGTGSLYAATPGAGIERVLTDVTVSNGLAWSPDRRSMYYIDTPTRRVYAFDYDGATGQLAGRREIIHFAEDEGMPDGMTIDSEGHLWIAHWRGWQVSKRDPATGELLLRIELPASLVTSCAFGGDRLTDLYITTARVGLSEEQLEQQPLAGGVFRVSTDVQGSATDKYGG